MSADLHLHSVHSDGSNTPAELVRMAADKQLKTIALADHDTVAGIAEAMVVSKKLGIELIPAIELSTFSQNGAEIHILGYYFDYQSEVLLGQLSEIMSIRIERAKKMIKKLNQLGVNISYQDVKGFTGDQYIGRPHIALAMVKGGYIKRPQQAFSARYIGNGGKAYVDKSQLLPADAIKLIIQAKGIPVLAHPYFINKGQPFTFKEIKQLTRVGLAGVEVYHAKHHPETSQYYLGVAEELDLLVTGGSDFHGKNSPGVELGDIRIDDILVDRIRDFKGKIG